MRFVVKIIETTTTYTQLTCMHLNMKVSGFPHKTSGGFPAAVLTAWTIHPVPGITWLEPTRILKLTFNTIVLSYYLILSHYIVLSYCKT